MTQNTIERGDYVLLMYGKKKRWLVKVEEEKEFHSHFGVISHDSLIGRPYGSLCQLPNGQTAILLKPTLRDMVKSFRHESQIIYPKDAAIISYFTGLKDGMKVIEAGTGSGALTATIATQVMPSGFVYTYEIRENALITARKNLKKVQITNVEFILHDVRDGFLQNGVDVVILDLADPWKVVPHAWEALVPCGVICIFQPTFNQLERTAIALEEGGFAKIEVFEVLRRNIQIKRGAIRPTTRMIGHTGFLIFAVKTFKTYTSE